MSEFQIDSLIWVSIGRLPTRFGFSFAMAFASMRSIAGLQLSEKDVAGLEANPGPATRLLSRIAVPLLHPRTLVSTFN